MKIQKGHFFRPSIRKIVILRRLFFLVSDTVLICAAMYISFWFRFNGAIPDQYKKSLPYFMLLALVLKLSILLMYNLYDISWRFVGLEEIIKVFKALSLASILMGLVLYFFRTNILLQASPFPRSILILDYVFSLIFMGSLRISKRVFQEGWKNALKMEKEKTRILVVGAGNAGEQIIREMVRNKNSNYLPVGLVDDDPFKQDVKIHGVKVMGTREMIPEIIRNNEIDEVLIALPSAHSKDIREIVQIIRESNTTYAIKILPGVTDLIDGKVTLSDIKEIRLEDLLGRAPVKVKLKLIKDFIREKTVLITGAGGSIGSELAKSIHHFSPKTLIALDIDDTELFYLSNRLKSNHTEIIPIIGDIRDEAKMRSVFKKYSPQIVLHAAAYKHVPILEIYPEEAVKTNVLGTKVVADLSLEFGVEKFIFISTDKAINPSSIMGATKRAGEDLLKILNQKNATKFISVRFGNVLGSRGSVITLFKEQIKRRKAITVTHPEMRRYFMITSEAVLLVLEASAIGEGGEVFVLDMGEPVKILDLAKEMIRLSGYEPDRDIPIVFSKIRPGEKLFEEILSAEEGVDSSKYEKILIARESKDRDPEVTLKKIDHLIKIGHRSDSKAEIVRVLKEIIPSYAPSQYDLQSHFW
jgi:FlaA1/EpsC-like NDP-sugar epimerase